MWIQSNHKYTIPCTANHPEPFVCTNHKGLVQLKIVYSIISNDKIVATYDLTGSVSWRIETMKRYPVVGIPSDVIRSGLSAFHGIGEKYINAVANGANVCPLLIPAQGPGEDLKGTEPAILNERLLDNLDGIFLSGSPSNIEPKLYSEEVSQTPDYHDPQRDSLSLPLIRAAVDRKVPILAVCRGMQELNVALGGTLHQQVHKVANMMDHREDKTLDRAGQYQDTHDVQLVKEGVLSKLLNSESARVNSLHGQGMKQLGKGLVAEAHAADGLVEAFRSDDEEHFLIAVQWHPEWRYSENKLSTALFAAFGHAVRKYADKHR